MKLGNIYNQILAEDFKSQTKRYLDQGIDSDIVKSYIEKFKHIRDKKYKEMFDTNLNISVDPKRRNDIDAYSDFHELEQLVDYVSGQRQGISGIGKSDAKETIEVTGEPIFKDANIELFYADNPRACIKYKGKFPYSWCVARSDSSNMFYTYRFKPYEPAFYFVKNLPATEKEFGIWNMAKNVFKGQFKNKYHFFVIQVPKNVNMEDLDSEQYIVSSANNDGDTQMSWKQILKINPKLAPLHKLLEPKPFTPEEREKHQKFKNGIGDKEFEKLSYEDKRSYLDIYPTIARPITLRQLQALPDDLLNLYVSFGIGLDDEQFAFIKPKKEVLKRYAQISKRKFDEYMNRDSYDRRQLKMYYSELVLLSDSDIKTYLESLSSSAINDFVHTNGEDKLELLEKHLPDKFGDEYQSIKKLVIAAKNDDEAAIEKLQSMLPEGVTFSFRTNNIIFDTSDYGAYIKDNLDDDKLSYFNNLDDRAHGYGSSYDYFDGDDEALTDTYKHYIETIIQNNPTLGNEVKSVGLGWDVDTIVDLLEKSEDDIKQKISEDYGEARDASEEKEWNEIRTKVRSIVYLDWEDVEVNLSAFLMFIPNHEFFSTDRQTFIDNVIYLLENILSGYDVPESYEEAWERVSEAGYNFNLGNENSITEAIEEAIEEALAFQDSDEEDDDSEEDYSGENNRTIKLKSQIVKLLNDTLSSLGQDAFAKTIENELVKIDIDRTKFHMDGKVYIKMTNKKSGEEHEGYVFIKDIPTYFTNHKLFEQLIKMKHLMRY
jgi:hypothetical protein